MDKRYDVIIQKSNEVFLKIQCEPHIQYELRDAFTFEVPNAKFMPQYRGKNWNGEIHLFDLRSKQIYVGLLDKIIHFCETYGYVFIRLKTISIMVCPLKLTRGYQESVRDYMKSITSF